MKREGIQPPLFQKFKCVSSEEEKSIAEMQWTWMNGCS